MKRLLYLFLLLLAPTTLYAQMLFSENMTMSLDSTKTLQGMITPSLNFQTDKENVLTFKNSANLNILIHRSRVVNILNKFEFSSYGKNVAHGEEGGETCHQLRAEIVLGGIEAHETIKELHTRCMVDEWMNNQKYHWLAR